METTLKILIGKRIRFYRKRAKLSQAALGISLSEFFLNIPTDTFNEKNPEINRAYQLLLGLPKEKQKLACKIIEDIVKIAE